MGLRDYRRKRDFRKTPEPRGKVASRHKKLKYLVQKHAASHLHYDFRLELDGVLKSWAVPKGPDLDPTQKRLAVQVEDHPLEYGDFEGTIPQGQYGGGTVMLWDQGTWEPKQDAEQGLREGHLKFELHGEKLHGGWMLVRRGGRKAGKGERNWFLFKERDEFAELDAHITDEQPLSVTTGRDLDEIAAEADRVWGPDGEKNGRKRSAKKSSARRQTAKSPKIRRPSSSTSASWRKLLADSGAKPARLPRSQDVQLATLAAKAPDDEQWLHEIKFDGYRMLCRIADGKAHFISRNGKDWSKKFPELVAAAARLPITSAMLDGEVVALEPDGVSRFQALQQVFQTGRTRELIYYAFDLLYLEGKDLTKLGLSQRKEILQGLIAAGKQKTLRFSDHLEGSGPEVFAEAGRLGLEGIVSKRRDQPYRPGRGVDWLKIKCSQREEFVIGGFTPPAGSREHFGALLLGYYDSDHELQYAGRVGTGFNDQTLASLHRKLLRLEQKTSPFVNLSGKTGQARGVRWLKPELVGEVEFSNWTDEGLLRHPSFQGLREDKPARTVVRDRAISAQEVNTLQKQDDRPKAAHGRKATARRKTPAPAKAKGPSHAKGQSHAEGTEAQIEGVRLSHPDKLLYPDEGLTKRDLANYYVSVADWMLPHVAGRPLALLRCPAGFGKTCFFQKHPGEGASEHLQQVDVAASGKPEYNLAVSDVAGVVALVQMGVLEIHAWGCLARQLEKPDRLVFDLDPDPTVPWTDVVKAALEMRELFEKLELTAFLKTTGGKGLHLVVPVRPRLDWEEAKAFCKSVADWMVRAAPDRYLATMSKAARKGKIFIDYLRNGRGATSVAAYSTRARAGAPVSMPIAWEELTAKLRPNQFTLTNAPARLARLKHDPWEAMLSVKQSITKAMLQRLE